MKRYSESDRTLDELLVLRILNGDASAVNKLGQRWYPRLKKVAYYLTGNHEMADEAAQNAWVGICRNWLSLSDPSKFSPWAFGILRLKCIDQIRVKKKLADRRDPHVMIEDLSAKPSVETSAAINQAFEKLPPDYRLTASLYFLQEMTLVETAVILDLPVGTVKSRIFKARQKLKVSLKGD